MTRTIVGAALLLLWSAGALHGRDAVDDRWLPWLGCWAPAAGAAEEASDGTAARSLLCFVPAPHGGVEVLTFAGDSLLATTLLSADGAARPVTERGCTGTESAAWSPQGHRLYVTVELTCDGSLGRVSRGVLAWLGRSEWLDVQVVQVGDAQASRARRYRAAPAPSWVAARLAGLAGRATAIESLRVAAARRLGDRDIVELVRSAGAEATGLLLVERGEGYYVDARTLAYLADAGVPGEITDLMIALSYPDRFALQRGSTVAAATRAWREGAELDPYGRRYPGGSYSSFDNCVIVGYDAFGRPVYGSARDAGRIRYGDGGRGWTTDYGYHYSDAYRRRGCSPLGYGDPHGWDRARYVPVRVGPSQPGQPTGRAVEGRGYTRPESARTRDTSGEQQERPARRAVRRPDDSGS
jgi:hypothetical protein